jgi:hypothetical protein
MMGVSPMKNLKSLSQGEAEKLRGEHLYNLYVLFFLLFLYVSN